MKKYKIEGHEPSLLPEGKKWALAWSNDFDGAIKNRIEKRVGDNPWGEVAMWPFHSFEKPKLMHRHGIVPTWTEEDLADCFIADYVRVFDAIPD